MCSARLVFLAGGLGFQLNLRALARQQQHTLKAVSMATTTAAAEPAFPDWPSKFDNSLTRALRADDTKAPHVSRQVTGAHFTRVRPTVPAPAPELVVLSEDAAAELGMSAADCASEAFLAMFSGSPPASTECWATVYGASFVGQYGGQRGDGRAISIGQVGGRHEVQLKGAGVTPFSRQFDGRAVLRSCVREFLASEAMAALGVPTTRALCVVATGDRVFRRWYDQGGMERAMEEPGAVGTRVAPSFLRFGQMEIFSQRGELPLLKELAEHALERDYAHLRVQQPDAPLSALLVAMYAEICERQATLVAEWLRVGYCQGNMNSDNSALGGVTLDYGPFAFMEKFNPTYNPWSGGGRPYCFGMQPQAAATNLAGLAQAFTQLIESVGKAEGLSGAARQEAIEGVQRGLSEGFVDTFHARNDEHCRRKLGLGAWDDGAQELWNELYKLMSTRCGVGLDFTLFFRALSAEGAPSAAEAVDGALGRAALQELGEWPSAHRAEWDAWKATYAARVAADALPAAERRASMERANPQYVLRNWMAAEAYEAAERGDYSIVREVHEVLRRPYDAQDAATADKYAQPTPQWARDRPGLAYMT